MSPRRRARAVEPVWTPEEWDRREGRARRRALSRGDEGGARRDLVRAAHRVLRTFSTSFFLVTRFLPRPKRERVELIYASVRYPDEIVDTFDLPETRKRERLERWATAYEKGLCADSLRGSLAGRVPAHLAGFCEVVREKGIDPDHYRAFLRAMGRDLRPEPYPTLEALIEDYVYGSAIIVGYCLTHVYGGRTPSSLPRALQAARDLGIALQLTNFVRDVDADRRSGRLYVPVEMLEAEGHRGPVEPAGLDEGLLLRARGRLAGAAEEHYARAEGGLDAFHPDSRVAIDACLRLYRRLNGRILRSPRGLEHRERLSASEKLAVLPRSKYWRLPLAWMAR